MVLPESLELIDDYAFFLCFNIKDLVIPDSVREIGDYAFSCSENLTDITVGENVENIGKGAFSDVNTPKKIYFKGDAPDCYIASAEGHSFEPECSTLYYLAGKEGWTEPDWYGYKTVVWNIAKIGDVNDDSDINVIDANIVRRAAAKLITLNDDQKTAADVNNDNIINVIDANLIRRYAAKLITEFPEAN